MFENVQTQTRVRKKTKVLSVFSLHSAIVCFQKTWNIIHNFFGVFHLVLVGFFNSVEMSSINIFIISLFLCSLEGRTLFYGSNDMKLSK